MSAETGAPETDAEPREGASPVSPACVITMVPDDIFVEIFSYLPLNLTAGMTVCKRWRVIARNPAVLRSRWVGSGGVAFPVDDAPPLLQCMTYIERKRTKAARGTTYRLRRWQNDCEREVSEDETVAFAQEAFASHTASRALCAASPAPTEDELVLLPWPPLLAGTPEGAAYQFMIQHSYVNHIDDYRWVTAWQVGESPREVNEFKSATYVQIVSPFGTSVEMRFFISHLQSSHPKFYCKLIYCPGRFDACGMREAFEDNPSLPALIEGGFGRVEVDVRPFVSAERFREVHDILQLPSGFPPQLLWNVVVNALGHSTLAASARDFVVHYSTSFQEAFAKAMM